jgi:hypothetical protein
MYLAEQLDRPGLEGARAADLKRLDEEQAAGLVRLREEHDSDRREALRGLEERYRTQARAIAERYLLAIHDFGEALNREMGIAVNGRFAGPRYREIERRLAEEKAAFERERARLGAEESREQRRLSDTLAKCYGAAKEQAEEEHHRSRQGLSQNDYVGDGRAENPLVDAFITVTNQVLGTGLHTLHFVFTFSLFLSLLIELGIWVAFENLTLAHLPIFMAEQEIAVSLGQKRAATEGDLRTFQMDEALMQGKISFAAPAGLAALLDEIEGLMHKREDDLRAYPITHPGDLWFQGQRFIAGPLLCPGEAPAVSHPDPHSSGVLRRIFERLRATDGGR